MISLLPLVKLNTNKLAYLIINLIFILLFAIIYWIFGTPDHFKVLSIPTQKYLSLLDSIYLSFTTHCTLGYGDIVPVSNGMKLITIIHTIIMIAYLFLVGL